MAAPAGQLPSWPLTKLPWAPAMSSEVARIPATGRIRCGVAAPGAMAGAG
eukprot:CAMPEP_0115703878 /NCGR_PEP_ID=MMETSP0272-20121206/69347_1 /TAXON_ID=71861 /ORGANISM="Scrippsiella trochoidea, Strain CCMP3099" /LENGTH=49 /DNA_ID= /DNA_START= /DNA_END= /DNA_ORIENTATION=